MRCCGLRITFIFEQMTIRKMMTLMRRMMVSLAVVVVVVWNVEMRRTVHCLRCWHEWVATLRCVRHERYRL